MCALVTYLIGAWSSGVSDLYHRGRGFDTHLGLIASNLEQVANILLLRPTQPPILSGTGNEYQPVGGDAVLLGSKGRYGFCLVAVELCDLSYNTRLT